jgi:carboxypeptidase PM20D1
MRRLLLALGVVAALVAAALVVNMVRAQSRQPLAGSPLQTFPLDRPAVLDRLSRAIQVQTTGAPAAFDAFRLYLEDAFPRMHASLAQERFGGGSLLYTWSGRDASLPAVLLLAHQDVVPADAASLDQWPQPPFSGRIAEGAIWGRGAIDDKAALVAMCEAIEHLLAAGFVPSRTILFAFGHDEEEGGFGGAQQIAAALARRGTRLEFVLDEGLLIVDRVLPVPRPVALIGIAEKGVANFELRASGTGGHASMPPPDTAIERLSRAIRAAQEATRPASLAGPARLMFDTLAPEMALPERIVFSNLWLFEPLVTRRMAAVASTNALVRTTVVPTKLEGGVRENVLPSEARAVLHARVRPGESVDDVLSAIRARVNDSRVQVEMMGPRSSPSPVSPVDLPAYRAIATAIRQTFPDVVVAPSLVLAATDSRHFSHLTDRIYRFVPIRLGAGEAERIHGIGERIGIDNYLDAVRFYRTLISSE